MNKEMNNPIGWEKIDDNTQRMWIPTGWIVSHRTDFKNGYGGEITRLVVVDDPEHSWNNC